MFFSYDPLGIGINFHVTEAEAKSAAEDALELALDNECEHDDIMGVCWGKVHQVTHVGEDEYSLQTPIK